MGFHAVKLPQVPAVPYWCSILVLLLICSLLSCSLHAKSACKCPSSDQDPSSVYTLSNTFDNLHGYLLPANSRSATFLSAGLGSYKKHHHPKLNLYDPGLLILDDQLIELWEPSGDGTTIHEASFSVVFTMSIYQPKIQKTPGGGNLTFAIFPRDFLYGNESFAIATQLYCYWNTSNPIVGSTTLAGNQFTIMAGICDQMVFGADTVQMTLNDTVICVEIAIGPSGTEADSRTNYSFSIDYNSLGHNMTVQVSVVDGEDKGKQSESDRVL
ncbi:uncharacterized protein LOC120674475 [Panicum virgatum]|uniref:Uncharacterized protein n=1 Tax=Panicum virgatum TaxID=38727 RepID=A0A8T0RQP8_PANVG|nr:uncharacterized protein LOC120674475 [Panicum virgatum]KAG2586869.1 hypothetical protein PVAP13_5NG085562 [Panicum virgatum]